MTPRPTMRRSPRAVAAVALLSAALLSLLGGGPAQFATTAQAQPAPPDYGDCYLTSIYPAGAARGSTVTVELRAWEKSYKGKPLQGVRGAFGLIVDGPPGITVGKVSNVDDHTARAELTVAPEAPPGRRMIRVRNAQSGLTNFCYFLVGTLPEVLEAEKNDEPARAQTVALPTVVNGRIGQALDVDCFRFEAKRGTKLTAAVAAHALDSRSMLPRGFVDATLEVLDAEGRVVADAADVVGLDPLATLTIPADGFYTARVKLVNFQGFPDAVYRLTLGEVPYPTAMLPAAVRRGTTVQASTTGPNVPDGATTTVAVPSDHAMPLFHASSSAPGASDVPLLATDLEEIVEREPNDVRSAGTPLARNQGASGRFATADDVDWYRLSLTKGDRLRLEIHAQRYLRSAADTHLAVFDAGGELVAENDDLASTDVEMLHDFETFDAALHFDPPTAGDYYVRVSQQSGTFGDRAVYHLSILDRKVDVRLHAWPDAVPIWGPGNTSAMVVTVERFGAPSAVELAVEGLPPGWSGSAGYAPGGTTPRNRAFVTLTAPATARVGDVAEFRIVGRVKSGAGVVERNAQSLTAYIPNDRQYCRVSPKLRAVVGRDIDVRLACDVREIHVAQGRKAEAVVKVSPAPNGPLPVSVNLAGQSFKCNLGVQQKLPAVDGVLRVPIDCDELPPGRYGIVVALAWGSELRIGMPGPCTPLIVLNVSEPTAAE